MVDHRSGRFRNGTGWCSKEELERLRREIELTSELDPDAMDPDAMDRYTRVRRRCSRRQADIQIGRLPRQGINLESKIIRDLIISAIERVATDDLSWRLSPCLTYEGGAKLRAWGVHVQMPKVDRPLFGVELQQRPRTIRPNHDYVLSVNRDYKRVLKELQRIGKELGWRKVSGRSDGFEGFIDVMPDGVFP